MALCSAQYIVPILPPSTRSPQMHISERPTPELNVFAPYLSKNIFFSECARAIKSINSTGSQSSTLEAGGVIFSFNSQNHVADDPKIAQCDRVRTALVHSKRVSIGGGVGDIRPAHHTRHCCSAHSAQLIYGEVVAKLYWVQGAAVQHRQSSTGSPALRL